MRITPDYRTNIKPPSLHRIGNGPSGSEASPVRPSRSRSSSDDCSTECLNERKKVMASVMDLFVQEIAKLPDIQETEGDRFGERSFRVGGREVLHIHGTQTL